ncbi:MAG: cytochrome c [Acidobacteria bacterium]|nr:cytochrome c [Acidobacteriota bacterium]
MSRRPVLGLLLAASLAGAGPDSAAIYGRHCAKCHGPFPAAKGAEVPRPLGPRLDDPRRLADRSDDELLGAILDGKGAMPGFRASLGEEEVRKLVQFLRNPRKGRRGAGK